MPDHFMEGEEVGGLFNGSGRPISGRPGYGFFVFLNLYFLYRINDFQEKSTAISENA
jgi:hypothetical protein